MSMEDLVLAKNLLKERNLSLVIVKNGKVIFESDSKEIKDFVVVIDNFKTLLNNASIADKIIGKAIALLCVYSKIGSAFAEKISNSAVEILRNAKIHIEFENKVEHILNKEKTDVCPFEKLLIDITEPEKAYEKIKSFLKSR